MSWFPNSPDFNSVKHLQNTHKNKKTVGIKPRERLGRIPLCLCIGRMVIGWKVGFGRKISHSWVHHKEEEALKKNQRFKKRKKKCIRDALLHTEASVERLNCFCFTRHKAVLCLLWLLSAPQQEPRTGQIWTGLSHIVDFFWCIFKLIVCKALSSTQSTNVLRDLRDIRLTDDPLV